MDWWGGYPPNPPLIFCQTRRIRELLAIAHNVEILQGNIDPLKVQDRIKLEYSQSYLEPLRPQCGRILTQEQDTPILVGALGAGLNGTSSQIQKPGLRRRKIIGIQARESDKPLPQDWDIRSLGRSEYGGPGIGQTPFLDLQQLCELSRHIQCLEKEKLNS